MAVIGELRKAIERSKKTRYAIAKGAGIDYDALVMFLDHDRDIRLSKVEALAKFFGMRLTEERKATGSAKL